jgi:dipeptidyl aminopeptidase/acylaminoacyl peptidase
MVAPRPLRTVLAAAACALLVACSVADPADPVDDAGSPGESTSDAAPTESDTVTESPSGTPSMEVAAYHPVSIPGVGAQTHRGSGLRLGAVREQTAGYTSYDVTWRVRSTGPGTGPRGRTLRLSGVLNVPRGRGPFPAVVLAHGYIDPAYYESGQGMTRERGFLAEHGWIALHVDYRGHAGSDPDPSNGTDVRLGYAVDVIGAVGALRASSDVPVDVDRLAVFGRSMGGGVVQKVAAISPGLVDAVVAWASVSSLEAENFDHFIRRDTGDRSRVEAMRRSHGLPEDAPDFWRGVSPRPYFDRITEPVLAIHGRFDDTCPPRWARETQRAMQQAGVDSQLAWYDDGHAFGPAFVAAMDRVVRFLEANA